MNKSEKNTIISFYQQTMYNFKLSLQCNDTTEIILNYNNVKNLTALCNNLNVDTTEYRKINKEEFIQFLNTTVNKKKLNYYFSVNDLLKGDYIQLIKDTERLEATDELLYMLDTALYFNLITENFYQLVISEYEEILWAE